MQELDQRELRNYSGLSIGREHDVQLPHEAYQERNQALQDGEDLEKEVRER